MVDTAAALTGSSRPRPSSQETGYQDENDAQHENPLGDAVPIDIEADFVPAPEDFLADDLDSDAGLPEPEVTQFRIDSPSIDAENE